MEPHRPVIGAEVAAGADAGLTAGYDLGPFFDEMFESPGRAAAALPPARRAALGDDQPGQLEERIRVANSFFLTQGIGFTVYGDDAGTDRIFPFDLVPRIVPADEWETIERGLDPAAARAQPLPRTTSTTSSRSSSDGRRSRAELVFGVAQLPPRDDRLRRAGRHLRPRRRRRPDPRRRRPLPRAGGQPAHAVGRQLHAREPRGAEADLRRALRPLRRAADRPVPAAAASRRSARSRPRASGDPSVVLLTPGAYNSAYFEHSFLARQMGIEIVEGRDLVVHRQPRLQRAPPAGCSAWT